MFMNLHLFRWTSLGLVLGLFCGCVSVERASQNAMMQMPIEGAPGTTEEYIHVSNYGYYLFNAFPIFCGNTADDRRGNTIWFSDEVTLAVTQDILIEEVKSRRCNLANLQPTVQSTCFFGAIPYIGNTLGILWYREVQISGIVVRPDRMKFRMTK